MGKVYQISKNVVLGLLILVGIFLVIIIALAIAYHLELKKSANDSNSNTTSSTSHTFIPKDPWDYYRLPGSLVPISYNVTLWPRLKPNDQGIYIFTGNSAVIFKCVKKTDLIIIHSNKLNFVSPGHHAKLSGLGGVTVPSIVKSWLVARTTYMVIQLRSSLTVGAHYVLQTNFTGELADDLQGLYRSEYKDNGEKKVVATSQMQATYARKTFPCFDEPAMKAIFTVTIIHSRDTVALSNSQRKESFESTKDGIPVKVTRFEPTQRMSTYLLAFIVCEFHFIQSNQGNLRIRIWAQKNAITAGQGAYALNVTGPILQFFERYYNTTYPLSKSDQIALPDFNAGAMENWGLITYRETALLYDSHACSTSNKERITTVISHELAHMWFGNLVTLRWWNDLWLNEGFASYVEYLGADYAEPTWDIKDHIILNDIHKVFAVDALASSHPLSRREEEVNSPDEIGEMFNTISYSKGAAVLRMLSEFLTEPVFAKGLSSYLNTFAFGNTVDTDLWEHLQKAVEKTTGLNIPRSVPDIMKRWTLQMGFPVVNIDTRTGNVTQKHFLLDPESKVERKSEFNYIWFVPIKWMKNGIQQDQYWLLQKTDTRSPMRVSGDEWIVANTNCSGYFRVNYDLENWERLLALLSSNHEVLSVINRAQIIDDAFNLARAKIIPTTLALRTTKYLSKERNYIPWESALRNIHYYRVMFERSEVFGVLQAYLKKQVQPLFEHFKTITENWSEIPTKHSDQYNQVNAVWLACETGIKECRELTKRWFSDWMKNPNQNQIHPNLKGTVYCQAIADGGVEEWEFAWRMLQNATLASEASRIRSALACTKEPWLLNRYLDYTLDPSKIRKQDALSTIVNIAGNVVGTPLAWNFVRAKWSYIFRQYGSGSFSLPRAISGVTKRFSTEFELQELKKFKEDNLPIGFGTATLTLEQAIERTRANIKWVNENKAEVLKWFTEESR